MAECRREPIRFAIGGAGRNHRAAIVPRDVHGEFAVVFMGEGMKTHAHFLKIVAAGSAFGLQFGLGPMRAAAAPREFR